MKTPVLETERLLLRPFGKEDVEGVFYGWENDPDVARYMYWTSHNDIHKTEKWIQKEMGKIDSDEWYRFAIVNKENGELVGTGLIYLETCGEFEIGYNLSKKAWGKGYTTEAMKEILRFAKEELGIHTVLGHFAKANPASGHVMEKLGFKFVKEVPYDCNDGGSMIEGYEYRLTM